MNNDKEQAFNEGYLKGAAEQLDKACEWLTNNLTDERDPQRPMWIAFVKEFRKQMSVI